MIITAFRTGPSLASSGLLPECKVLRTEDCAVCGEPYILVVTEDKQMANEAGGELAVHVALLRDAITRSHATGHPNSRLLSDGRTVRQR